MAASTVTYVSQKVSLRGCISTILVYSSVITLDKAITRAYQLGSADQDVTLSLQHIIKTVFQESDPIPSPPTADEIVQSKDEIVPADLNRFLVLMMTGDDAQTENNEKTQ